MARGSLNGILKRALIAAFLGCLFLKDFVGTSIPSIAFMAVWLLLLMVADRSTAAAFTLACVICFASTISITIPMAVYIVLTFIRRGSKVKMNSVVGVSILIVFLESMHIFASSHDEFRSFVNTAMVILLVAMVVVEIYDNFVLPQTVLKYYLGLYSFLALDVIWATVRQLGSISAIISSNFRIGQVDTESEALEGVLGMNANGLALLSVMAVAVLILMLPQKQIKSLTGWGLIVFSSLVGFLTVSKTFLLVLGLLIILAVSILFVKMKRKFYEPIGVLSGLSLLIFWLTKQRFFLNIIDRFSEDDLTTGRIDISIDYLNKMSENFSHMLFGVGIQNIHNKLGMVHSVHNAIIEIYVCAGILGLVLYFVYFVSLCRMGNRFLKKNEQTRSKMENFIPFIVYFVFIQSLQFFRINYIYAMIAVCFACMALLSAQKITEEKR